jgi:hypothetical protein
MTHFELQPMPRTFSETSADFRACRACGGETAHVLRAQRTAFAFPCCDSASCQQRVRVEMRREHRELGGGLRKRTTLLGRCIVYTRRLLAMVGRYELNKQGQGVFIPE